MNSQSHLRDTKQDPKNARRHNPRNVGMVESSIQREGFGRSILLANDGTIIAGNATAEAAASAGLEDMIVIDSDGTKVIAVRRTDVEPGSDRFHKLAVSDNRSAELADWDPGVIQELIDAGKIDQEDYFYDDELDALLASLNEPPVGLSDPDDVPAVPDEPVTKPGDLWFLGRHRLLCGDATNILNVDRVMNGQKADATVTDPPYGVGVDYGAFEDSERNVREMIQGFMAVIQDKMPAAFTPGVPVMSYYPKPAWLMVWVHPAASGSGPWGFTGTNPILVYGKDPYLAAGMGRRHDNIVLAADREGLEGHPAIKPIKVWSWLVERMTTKPGQIVFDPFLGSGTTLIACEELGRSCYGLELDPHYCDVIVNRWQNFTGSTAVLAHDHAMAAD